MVKKMYLYQAIFLILFATSSAVFASDVFDNLDGEPVVHLTREDAEKLLVGIKDNFLNPDMSELHLHVIVDKQEKKDFPGLTENTTHHDGQEGVGEINNPSFGFPSNLQEDILTYLLKIGNLANNNLMAVMVGLGALIAVLFQQETRSMLRKTKSVCVSAKQKVCGILCFKRKRAGQTQ